MDVAVFTGMGLLNEDFWGFGNVAFTQLSV